MDRVTSLFPNFHVKQYDWPHIKGFQLADPNFFIQSPIDVLCMKKHTLEADIFSRLINGSAIIGPVGTPTGFPSKFGWFLCGQVDFSTKASSSVMGHIICTNNDFCVNETLMKFFNIFN